MKTIIAFFHFICSVFMYRHDVFFATRFWCDVCSLIQVASVFQRQLYHKIILTVRRVALRSHSIWLSGSVLLAPGTCWVVLRSIKGLFYQQLHAFFRFGLIRKGALIGIALTYWDRKQWSSTAPKSIADILHKGWKYHEHYRIIHQKRLHHNCGLFVVLSCTISVLTNNLLHIVDIINLESVHILLI